MTPQMQELGDLAQRYCQLVDGIDEANGTWLGQIASLLPRLHAAIASLELPLPQDGHCPAVDLDARFELYSQLRKLLGENDSYWMEFDVAGDGQSKSGSLADDLTDIYCELKFGLRLFEGEPERAIEGWHKGYHLHWGQHLVDAERHLYELRARNLLTDA